MAYRLQPGEDESIAAHRMLGDARLTHEIMVINGVAYLRDEKAGPPAPWAADPNKLRHGKEDQEQQEQQAA